MTQKLPALCVLLLLVLAACRNPDDSVVRDDAGRVRTHADALDRGLTAHGGLAAWQEFGSLEFELHKGDVVEQHLIDLRSRMLRIEGDGYTIGFDGENVWVAPSLEAYPRGNPRFYSSLNFYFFGLPFLLADPGTVREPLGLRTVDGKTYDVVKVGFEEGVGDSPDDYYLAHFDTTTGLMDMLLYTVTYRSGEPNENYSGRTYEWHEVQGLTVPSKMSSYRWNAADSTMGEHRSDTYISKVMFSVERPKPERFAKPEDAEIAQKP